jgi:hypothetical protein
MMTMPVVMLVLAIGVHAAADFSGQWTADPPPANTAGDMGSGWGSPITISQDERQLVVEQALFSRYDLQPAVRTVYVLDGSESRNAVMTGHATQVRVSRARWDGDSLIIATSYPAVDPGTGKAFTIEVSQRLTLESAGVLIIEATRSGVLGGKPSTTKTTYRKK